MNAPERTTRGPEHISEPLRRFLREHEPMLRAMAADEAERGEFTLGLSRCIDLLDQPKRADRVAPEKAAPPVVLPRVPFPGGSAGGLP